jgi:hypothetical protein
VALPIHGKELGAREINRWCTEPTVPADPVTNCNRINIPKRSCRRIIDDFEAEKARTPRGVKTKHRISCDANAIMRHNTEHERAGRRTPSVNYNLLTGIANDHIARPIRADIAAAVVRYTNNGRRTVRKCGAQNSRDPDEKSDMPCPKMPSRLASGHVGASNYGVLRNTHLGAYSS